MKRIRYALVPAVAALMFGLGGTAQADSFKLYIGSPGAFGFQSGHGYYGPKSHYQRRHVYKRHYRGHRKYWRGGHRYGHYKPRYRHPGRHYGQKFRDRGPRHGYRGHRRHGWKR